MIPEGPDKPISQLPTLLDILEKIALDEEFFALDKSIMRRVFPNHPQEGYFMPVEMPDDTQQLWPMSLGFNCYYRGQSEYYSGCYPSLYRPNMTEADRFIERLKACELELLMKKHPMVGIFDHGLEITDQDGRKEILHLSVDYLALAQHYGIKTELLDLTVDKWVAAFFACTKYDARTETYSVYDGPSEFGVFYIDCTPPDSMMSPFKKERLRAVGLQPFSRPGEQGGYVYRLDEGMNFNTICEPIFFRHDRQISELIFNYSNRQEKLFPYDLLQDKARIIREGKAFTKQAFLLARERYYKEQDEQIVMGWLQEKQIELVDDPVVIYTDQERTDFMDYWHRHDKEFCSRIQPQLVERFQDEELKFIFQ